MEKLLQIAKEKLKMLQCPANPELLVLPQLMLTVFNEETPDKLDLNIYDRNEMEQEITGLLTYSDSQVQRVLGLTDQDRIREVALNLEKALSEDQLREVLIVDVLYEAMKENLDDFPNQLRLSGEQNRGEAFL